MNKTVTINISGIVFHIEEDAYQRLYNYLESLRRKFQNEEGRDEILADIESRIAEILTQKKGPNREVVIMKDIDEVIEMMGQPEDISDAEEKETSSNENDERAQQEYAQRRNRRRLFRDIDDKVVGGVCSGIGHYFDIDPIWIRLGFVAMFFIGGTGVLFYLLLMIIIPRAETTAEKLEMRGEPVDVNNISRTIKEEFEEFGNRMKDFGKEAKDWGKSQKEKYKYEYRYNRRTYPRRGPDDFFRGIFHVIGRFFGFLMVFIGISFLIGILTSTFSVTSFGPDAVIFQIRSLFETPWSYSLGIVAFLLVFGIPTLMMIYYGFKILFRLQRADRWVGISALTLWIAGIILGIISVMDIAEGFSEGAEHRNKFNVVNAGMDTVSVRVNIDPDMENDDYRSKWNRRYHFEKRWHMIHTDETTIKFGYAQLDIVPATGDSIELIVYKNALGRTHEEAKRRCDDIEYNITQSGNEFVFPSAFTIGKEYAWKGQEVDVELRLPVGTVIYLDPTTEDLIYDIENVYDVLDEDMVDRRWRMTKTGLECIDCAGLNLTEGKSPDGEFQSQMEMKNRMDSATNADTVTR